MIFKIFKFYGEKIPTTDYSVNSGEKQCNVQWKSTLINELENSLK